MQKLFLVKDVIEVNAIYDPCYTGLIYKTVLLIMHFYNMLKLICVVITDYVVLGSTFEVLCS